MAGRMGHSTLPIGQPWQDYFVCFKDKVNTPMKSGEVSRKKPVRHLLFSAD